MDGYVVCQRETTKLFSFFCFLFSWSDGWEGRALQECNLSAQFVRGLQDASGPVFSHCLKPGFFDTAEAKTIFRPIRGKMSSAFGL
jgi:hypothetical protein